MKRIAFIVLLTLVFVSCDDMQMTDVVTDPVSDTRPYTRTPSLDITLDIPDALKFKVPVFIGNGHRRFSDISHTQELSRGMPLMINDRLYFRRKIGHQSIESWHENRPDVLLLYDKITLEPIPEHDIEIQHGHKFNWQLNDGSLPQSEWNFSVSGIRVDRHIDNLFNGAYITADATHIYYGASLGIYSGFDLDCVHDPTLDIDINGVIEFSPFGNAGLVNVGDRMYLPGSDSEGAVDEDGNMEIKLFAFTK